jgi:hypothetical protein
VSHRYGDERIVEWLNNNQYHPRSPAHGSASCLYLLDDLLEESDKFRDAAESGEIVYQEDFTVGEGPSKWNTDLVVGPPGDDVQVTTGDDRAIAESTPEEIWLAIDAKSVMTEHGKARRNRQRDINSFADIMHRHYPGAVTGGLLLINIADRFKSPLRDEGDITEHDRIESLVEETVEMFRDIDRAEGDVSPNVDGVGCVVVDHTNLDDGEETTLATDSPAPQEDDITHYHRFLDILLETLESRWLTGAPPDLSELRELEDLHTTLDRQVVELAHAAHLLGDEIDDGDVDRETIERLESEVAEIEAVVESIESEYEDD